MRREGGKDIADGRNGMKRPVELQGQAGGQPFPKWGQETGFCHQVWKACTPLSWGPKALA